VAAVCWLQLQDRPDALMPLSPSPIQTTRNETQHPETPTPTPTRQVNHLVSQGELWRLLTPTLVHASLFHLAMNVLALHMLGPTVEALLGRKRFAAVYALSAVAGNGLAWWMGSSGFTMAVGASSSVSGLFGAYGERAGCGVLRLLVFGCAGGGNDAQGICVRGLVLSNLFSIRLVKETKSTQSSPVIHHASPAPGPLPPRSQWHSAGSTAATTASPAATSRRWRRLWGSTS